MEFPIIPLITALFSHSKNNIGGACCAVPTAEISQGLSFILYTFLGHLLHASHGLRALQSAFSYICQQETSFARDLMASRGGRAVSSEPQCPLGQVVRSPPTPREEGAVFQNVSRWQVNL